MRLKPISREKPQDRRRGRKGGGRKGERSGGGGDRPGHGRGGRKQPAKRDAAPKGDAAPKQDRQSTTNEGPRTVDEQSMPVEEQAEVAEEFVIGLIEAIGLVAETHATPGDDLVEVEVTGSELGLLVGPKAATLSAIEELTRAVVQREAGGQAARVRVDVGGYRAKRREALAAFTEKVVDEVLESGEERAMEPMGASRPEDGARRRQRDRRGRDGVDGRGPTALRGDPPHVIPTALLDVLQDAQRIGLLGPTPVEDHVEHAQAWADGPRARGLRGSGEWSGSARTGARLALARSSGSVAREPGPEGWVAPLGSGPSRSGRPGLRAGGPSGGTEPRSAIPGGLSTGGGPGIRLAGDDRGMRRGPGGGGRHAERERAARKPNSVVVHGTSRGWPGNSRASRARGPFLRYPPEDLTAGHPVSPAPDPTEAQPALVTCSTWNIVGTGGPGCFTWNIPHLERSRRTDGARRPQTPRPSTVRFPAPR